MINSVKVPIWLILLCLVAAVIRLYDLGGDSITHPEVYIPGIDLIPEISTPPPRHSWVENIYWHWNFEPHPPGYYLGMFAWTELTGTSEFALRLPSVIFGALSIILIYAIGRQVFGPATGVISAVLLTLHGFHIHWSQAARMYVPGAFWGLLTTWFLLKLCEQKKANQPLEIAYVLSALAGAQTVELFWPFLLVQVGWLVLTQRGSDTLSFNTFWRPQTLRAYRVVQVHAIAMLLAAPGVSHIVYLSRKGAVPDPDPLFLQEYFTFGFLFMRDEFAMPMHRLPLAWELTLLVLALVVLLLSVLKKPIGASDQVEMKPISYRFMGGLATIVSVVMIWLAVTARRRNEAMAVLSLLPFLALFLPMIVMFAASLRHRIFPRLSGLFEKSHGQALLIFSFAIIPPLVLYVASLAASVLAERAFLLFIPYLIILFAAGLVGLQERMKFPVAAIVTGIVLSIFAASVPFAYDKPKSPNDYKTLAHKMHLRMAPDDLVLVGKKRWNETPLFYYMRYANYIVEDYETALAEHPEARVWLVTLPWEKRPVIPAVERRQALAAFNYERVENETLDSLRMRAELYVKKATP